MTKLNQFAFILCGLLCLLVSFPIIQIQADADPIPAPRLQTEEPTLTLSQPVEREMKGGETHRYAVNVPAGYCLNVKVDQNKLNVMLRVVGSDDKEMTMADYTQEFTGPDFLTFVADVAGIYHLELKPFDNQAEPGRYTVQILELRPATQDDRDRMQAQQRFQQALRTHFKHTKEAKEAALQELELIRGVFHRVKDPLGEANALDWMAKIIEEFGRTKEAKELNLQALALKRTVDFRLNEATTLNNLAIIHNRLGEFQEALTVNEEALKISMEFDDNESQGIILSNIGRVYNNLGDAQKALDYFRRAIPIKQIHGTKSSLAETISNIGTTYIDLGEAKLAQEYYFQALALCRETGKPFPEGILLNNIALTCNRLGEPQRALDYYTQALAYNRKTGNRNAEALVLLNTGMVYLDLGEPRKSIDLFKQAQHIWQATGDRQSEATALNNLGLGYSRISETTLGIQYYQQSLELRKSLGDRSGQAVTLNNLGTVMVNDTEYTKALEYFQQSLTIAQESGDKESIALALQNIGGASLRINKPQESLPLLTESVRLWQNTGNRSGLARALSSLAETEQAVGQLQDAKTHFEQALEQVEFIRARAGSQDLRTSFFARIQNYYRLYINLLLQLHRENPLDGYDRQAFQISEQARARSLLDLLAEARMNIRQGAEPQLLEHEQALKKRITNKLERLSRLLTGKHTQAQKNEAEKEIGTLTDEYRQVQAEIRQKSPQYASLTQARTITVEELQTQVLDPDTILLEYVLGAEQSHLFAVSQGNFAVYPLPGRDELTKAARQVYELLTKRSTALKELAQERSRTDISPEDYQARVAAADRAYPQAAAELSRMLLGPVQKEIRGQRLVIVADGALQIVPFAALPVPNPKPESKSTPYLIERHEIVVVPSASTLVALRRIRRSQGATINSVAVLADPVFTARDERAKGQNLSVAQLPDTITRHLDQFSSPPTTDESGNKVLQLRIPRLPGTRVEAEAIRKITGDTSLIRLDFQANREAALNPELSKYRYIHLATHGYLNASRPELSAVLLSLVNEQGETVDGFLRLEDLYNLNWPAEVVTLSACQTGLGADIKGEGIVGLTRGLMYAGARRVVVSSWNVSDQATAQLMTKFYQGMLRDGNRPAAALRAAQIQMLGDKRWRAPYFWAAFQLQGEWR
ncbi:MAG: CHAT domain-containing protein [Acidobacteria bacterium]|nr:CHAT domain-containing protein [Acidobacteriota bacterium]